MAAFIGLSIDTNGTTLSVPTPTAQTGIHGPDPQSFPPRKWSIWNPDTSASIYGTYANNGTPRTPVVTGGSTAADGLKLDFCVVPGSVLDLENTQATSITIVASAGTIAGVSVMYER